MSLYTFFLILLLSGRGPHGIAIGPEPARWAPVQVSTPPTIHRPVITRF